MYQAALDLDTLAADHADRVGFDIGWDHARHGLVPPVQWMLDGTPLRQGWSAARAVYGQRTLATTRPVRQWLALRLAAWREAVPYECTQLTPNYLCQLDAAICPVTLRRLGGVDGDAATVQRLRPDAGFAAGVLATLSRDAARAMDTLGQQASVAAAWAQSKATADADSGSVAASCERKHHLSTAAWQRLAVLMSFVMPLPHAEAARLPLLVMPPNRVRVLNAIQGLQVVLTWHLASPGWSLRLRQIAAMISDSHTRHEFLLFVGALAPRVMSLPEDGTDGALRMALGALWMDERVQRRWTMFALSLGELAAKELATRAAAVGLRGRRVLVHDDALATEGWAPKATADAQANSRSRLARRPGAADVSGFKAA